MDIQGGMANDIFNMILYGIFIYTQLWLTVHIYDSMTRGLKNANVFVPLLTPEYNASDNCKREYVKES